MRTAIAGYTPNVPWARFGEPTVVDFDGNGTSSATPQVAAAAALWIDKHRADYDAYREGWMRVEAVRKALFESAAKGDAGFAPELGARHAPRRRRARAWRGAGFATGCDAPRRRQPRASEIAAWRLRARLRGGGAVETFAARSRGHPDRGEVGSRRARWRPCRERNWSRRCSRERISPGRCAPRWKKPASRRGPASVDAEAACDRCSTRR